MIQNRIIIYDLFANSEFEGLQFKTVIHVLSTTWPTPFPFSKLENFNSGPPKLSDSVSAHFSLRKLKMCCRCCSEYTEQAMKGQGYS